jgi:putative DNA primase/helicase
MIYPENGNTEAHTAAISNQEELYSAPTIEESDAIISTTHANIPRIDDRAELSIKTPDQAISLKIKDIDPSRPPPTPKSVYELEDYLRTYMQSMGFHFNGAFSLNDEVQRFSSEPHKSKKPEWYVGSIRAFGKREGICCTFGSWKTGEKHTYNSWKNDTSISEQDRKIINHDLRKLEAEHKRRVEEEAKRKQEEARDLFDQASDIPNGSVQYFKDKQVALPEGVKYAKVNISTEREWEEHDTALIALQNIDGIITGVQSVCKAGKRFKGTTKGAFFQIGEIKADSIIAVVEGYATGSTIYQATGYPTVCAMSAGNLNSVVEAFKKKYPKNQIIICGDDDKYKPEIGNTGRFKAEEAARRYGCVVIYPTFTEEQEQGKPTDWNDLHCLGGIEVVRDQIETKTRQAKEKITEIAKPYCLIDKNNPDIAFEKGIEILATQDGCNIYQHSGYLVKIKPFISKPKKANKPDKTEIENGTLLLSEISETEIIHLMHKKYKWKISVQTGEGKERLKEVAFPLQAAKFIMKTHASDDYAIPYLKFIVTTPVFLRDGTLLQTEGYHEESGLYLDFQGVKFPLIKENLTKEDATKALSLLEDLISEFPFEDDISKAVALAEIITGTVRRSIPLAPLFINDASSASSGKTELAVLVGIIATGHHPATIVSTSNIEEIEKQIDTMLCSGSQVVNIDNLKCPLDSAKLCAILTSPYVNVREFGTNTEERKTETNNFWVANGNNTVIKGDLCTRSLKLRLIPKQHNPEERVFPRTLLDYAKEHRPEIVEAIFTIIRAYICAGMPMKGKLPEFRNYGDRGGLLNFTSMIRAPLVWLGMKDPYESTKSVKEDDPEKDQLTRMLIAINEAPLLDTFTIKSLLETANNSTRREESEQIAHLHEVLVEVAGDRNGLIDKNLLGYVFRKYKDRKIFCENQYGEMIELALGQKGKDRVNAVLWSVQKTSK